MSILFDINKSYSDFMNLKPKDLSEFAPAVPRTLCTDCGISRTKNPQRCGQACQFIKPDYSGYERKIHGRERNLGNDSDELYFGTFQKIYKASMKIPLGGAQWTGITTGIAAALLENKIIDAVICVKPDPDDRWKPVPTLVTSASELEECRGMRMGYAPTLALVEPAVEAGFKRIAFIGIPCQVYALRALEEELGLERLYVIGTPCSDNTTTENFHTFLELLSDNPESISYLEFRADYQVELRFDDGKKQEIPFLKLPISKLPPNFFPLTCQSCVDYTNALSDITVGYMGGQGEQWVIVRNERGKELLAALGDTIKLSTPGTSGNRKGSVKGFMNNLKRSTNGLPVRSMPDFMRPIVAWIMPKIGPSGMEFARARLEMKAIESILHLRKARPAAMKNMVPNHVWKIASKYGLQSVEENKE